MGSSAKARIQGFINSLALKPVRTCRKWTRHCALCLSSICPGQQCRGDREGQRVHEYCFQAVVRDRVMKEVNRG